MSHISEKNYTTHNYVEIRVIGYFSSRRERFIMLKMRAYKCDTQNAQCSKVNKYTSRKIGKECLLYETPLQKVHSSFTRILNR